MTPTTALTLNPEATNLNELASLHATILVGVIGGIETGTSNDYASAATPFITNKPWIDPPEGFVPFDQQSSIALITAVPGVEQEIVYIDVPDGMDGVIKAISWNFVGGGFVQGSGDLVVRVLRDQAAVRNFDNILVEKGTIQQPRNIPPIRIWSKQHVSIRIIHANNLTLNGDVVGCLQGYFYPSKS